MDSDDMLYLRCERMDRLDEYKPSGCSLVTEEEREDARRNLWHGYYQLGLKACETMGLTIDADEFATAFADAMWDAHRSATFLIKPFKCH